MRIALPPGRRSLRVRLLVLISGTLVVVCAAMALTTVLTERLFLMHGLDTRVGNAAARSQGGLQIVPGDETNLSFLYERGQAVGTLAARYGSDGTISAAGVVTEGGLRRLGAEQFAVLADVRADGAVHTRTIPSLGDYRVTRLAAGGPGVLAGLPFDAEQRLINKLVVAEAVVALAVLVVAGVACAVVIRRQLRPWAGSPPPPSRCPGPRWATARSRFSRGCPSPIRIRAARPARSGPRSTA